MTQFFKQMQCAALLNEISDNADGLPQLIKHGRSKFKCLEIRDLPTRASFELVEEVMVINGSRLEPFLKRVGDGDDGSHSAFEIFTLHEIAHLGSDIITIDDMRSLDKAASNDQMSGFADLKADYAALEAWDVIHSNRTGNQSGSYLETGLYLMAITACEAFPPNENRPGKLARYLSLMVRLAREYHVNRFGVDLHGFEDIPLRSELVGHLSSDLDAFVLYAENPFRFCRAADRFGKAFLKGVTDCIIIGEPLAAFGYIYAQLRHAKVSA